MPARPPRPATLALAALALACGVVAVLWWWQTRFEAGVLDGSLPMELAMERLESLRRGLALGMAACLLGLAGVFGWMARRLQRDGLWPPGGKTPRVLDARWRQRAVIGLLALAVVTLLGALLTVFSALR